MGNELLILDGGMGTMLQAGGLLPGMRPELFGIEHPQTVQSIQEAYVAAGSRVIYANTFGANRHKLAGTGVTVAQAVSAAVTTAKKAAAGKARVALDVGPVGELLAPLGTLSFEEAYALYAEMAQAGHAAGADLIVCETFTDLYDAKAALLAAKENTPLPVWVTMSFEASGRTFTGTTVACAAATLTALGAAAVGINCSLGPDEILPLAKEMAQWTDLPLIIKPNAGLPDPQTGTYGVSAEEFAEKMKAFLPLGVFAVGGCCGTTPEFIRCLAPLKDLPQGERATGCRRGVCSAGKMVELSGLHVVGERLNPTGKKRFQQAIRDRDMDYILKVAVDEEDAGAEILDVNVGLPGTPEAENMAAVVKAVQSVVLLPLQLDATDPAVLEAGLRAVCGRPVINSVNGSEASLRTVLPLAKRYGAAIVGLAMDENGIPQSADARFAIAKRIVDEAQRLGIPKEDILIDCLTLTVSAQQDQAAQTLAAVRRVRGELGTHCTLGVSNISFGLPAREEVTQCFLTQAIACGLDYPIINPNQKRMMDAVASCRVLSGEDAGCAAYVERFAGQPQQAAPTGAQKPQLTIQDAIARGLKEETAQLARQMLEQCDELTLVNETLIPALDFVGEQYEKQILFLPQLINAANAACAAFDIVKQRIANRGAGSVSRGKVVLATVHGDIHDIGKNIVRVILENYGFEVFDLGRDVPPERVVEAALREKAPLVGLSALMTTTVPAMEETIRALRQAGCACKVMVGGAVLTEDYAAQIGADYYAKDARASAQIAQEVMNNSAPQAR